MKLIDLIYAESKVISRFSVTGIVATLVHMGVSFALLNLTSIGPQAANFCGFLTALGFSYFGHYHFSFKSSKAHGTAIPRFLATTAIAYLCNILVVAALTSQTALGANISLFLGISTMPFVSLILSRVWVY